MPAITTPFETNAAIDHAFVHEHVQWIEPVQAEVGMGTEIVRMPRKPIDGQTRAAGLAMIRERLAASR